jgi:hypothetical protein
MFLNEYAMNPQKDSRILVEHFFQISFLQYLQVLQIYNLSKTQDSVPEKLASAGFPRVKIDQLVRAVEICEMALAKIPDSIIDQSQLQAEIRGLERKLHQLVKFFRRFPYVKDEPERDRMVMIIEEQIRDIRSDFWEVIDSFEQEDDPVNLLSENYFCCFSN